MSLKDLETRYADLLDAQLKAIPEQVSTFFDIAGFPQRERVLSNFLAYYLNPAADHGFGDLFLTALNQLISEKTGRTIIQNTYDCRISPEVKTTIKGKFIDIVIEEEADNGTTNAIIIENKVNAALYNDLEEYYNHVNVSRDKVGVVLSRRPYLSLPTNYVCITHAELIKQIEQAAGPYFMNANIKHIIFFKEYSQNIRNMTSTQLHKEHYDFYYKHKQKIDEISTIVETMKSTMLRQAELACEMLDLGLKVGSKHRNDLRHYFSPKTNVYFTVWVEDLLNTPPELLIYVELDDAGMAQLDQINKISFTPEEKKFLKETSMVRKSYIHYAEHECNPTTDEIMNLSDYIVNQITQTPLKSIFLKIENRLTNTQTQ